MHPKGKTRKKVWLLEGRKIGSWCRWTGCDFGCDVPGERIGGSEMVQEKWFSPRWFPWNGWEVEGRPRGAVRWTRGIVLWPVSFVALLVSSYLDCFLSRATETFLCDYNGVAPIGGLREVTRRIVFCFIVIVRYSFSSQMVTIKNLTQNMIIIKTAKIHNQRALPHNQHIVNSKYNSIQKIN